MGRTWKRAHLLFVSAVFVVLACPGANADVITEWNARSGRILVGANIGPGLANCVRAVVQTAVYEAVNAITKRYPESGLGLKASRTASIEAAVAAANRAVLARLVPFQKHAIDSMYQAALASLADGQAKTEGIALGEEAAAAVIANRAEDHWAAPECYRPFTAPGVYVPTVIPMATEFPKRKPWFMTSTEQFRPGPPPVFTSEIWARDYNEIQALGRKNSIRRSPAQTEIALFWEETMPPIYDGLIASVAEMPGREVTENARMFAVVAQAGDDAIIAVMEAKYHYNFWRPITAIRNGDIDGNNTTERDSDWTPLISTPMHPEYPCAHCIMSGVVGTIIEAEIGNGPMPVLSTTSAAAGGARRTWNSIKDFMQEVANARVYDGVHFRNSTAVGTEMGKQIGALAVARYLQPNPRGSDR
ncbi:MAG: vanadium-dependent haloperoxidase [Bacteroidetes bacterium]|nr:vanadium-dependent haloperoxidase [Bacteroidota bacterium]